MKKLVVLLLTTSIPLDAMDGVGRGYTALTLTASLNIGTYLLWTLILLLVCLQALEGLDSTKLLAMSIIALTRGIILIKITTITTIQTNKI